MIHTLTINNRILSGRVFDEIYKGLELISGLKPRKIGEGHYVIKALEEEGFTFIHLINKRIDSKYKNNYMMIKITINPSKILGRNNLEVLEDEQLEKLKIKFNEKVKKIHNSLPRLEHWTTDRIDYAINIDTPYVEEYIKLFQRADKPGSFKELYCSKSKVRKHRKGSFYLFNDSVTINFYNKESERFSQNLNKDGAKNLLRLEIQCKKSKTNTIKAKNEFDSKHLEHYLSKKLSYEQIQYYYNNTIGTGDYYKLSEAIQKVDDSDYTSFTKNKLTEVLKAINKHRSIWRAREESQYNSSCFDRYLKQIRALGINPVTIPAKWKIKKLENIITIIKFL